MVKTIGLLGGTTWLSTLEYYRLINQKVNASLGGLHSAKILLHSIDFAEFMALADRGDWDAVSAMFVAAAGTLERAGAECLLLCSNTTHKIAGAVAAATAIPLIHIARETALAIRHSGLSTVALLGTRFTMEDPFFSTELSRQGITTIIPEGEARAFIHRTIFEELGKGLFTPGTRAEYLSVISTLAGRGAQGVVFGCTEIPLLITPEESPIRVFDTTLIHAGAAAEFALRA